MLYSFGMALAVAYSDHNNDYHFSKGVEPPPIFCGAAVCGIVSISQRLRCTSGHFGEHIHQIHFQSLKLR